MLLFIRSDVIFKSKLNPIDFIGKKYGKLTIENAYWEKFFMYFDIRCECGDIQEHVMRQQFFNRKNMCCRKCRQEEIDRKIKLEDLIGQKFNKLTVVNAYREKRRNSNVYRIITDCVCDCGEERKHVEWYKLTSGTVYSCKKCAKSISAMEIFILDILNKNNVEVECQKRYPDCKDVFELPFDFYLPKYNLLIEYDGEQHFIEKEFGNFDFESIQKHDKMKNEYAEIHNIELIRFNYKQSKKVIENELLLIIGDESRKNY